MATVKIKVIAKQRDFDSVTTLMSDFITGLAALDVVYTSQVIKVAELPGEYWGAIIIWSDDA